MPPPLLIDLNTVDLNKVEYDHEYIYTRMPHRYEFELLDHVCFLDREKQIAVGEHKCSDDDWWAKAHIPGMPIFPGILQLEAAAQLTAFMSRYVDGYDRFIAFGGVQDCRFREAVRPPSTFYLVAKAVENRTRRVIANTQGFVNGRLVFEAQIIGLALPPNA